MKKYLNRIFPKKFGTYWKKIQNSKDIDETLKFVTNNFINSKSYKLVSNYWHILNIKNYESLLKNGINKYGSTIAKNYYTFTELHHDEWFEQLVNNLKKQPFNIDSAEIFKKHDGLNLKESISYNYLCYLLFYNLKKSESFNQLKKLNDSTYLGFNDPYINIEKIKVSTDKIVSLFDFEKINKSSNLDNIKNILELGAGSGRTCEAILTLRDNIKYILCDITPAIYISYNRLKSAFPKKKISLLIDITDKVELDRKINESDIAFIFPHQLELLNKKIIDLTIAIDCMHEMDKSTIKYYFKIFNYITKFVYLSIWDKAEVPFSKSIFRKRNILHYDSGDYEIPKNWKNIFREKIVFPSNQISLGFEIKD